MAQAPTTPTASTHGPHAAPVVRSVNHHAPLTPGKVAMWLFLATEVMFFTGLIGSYIVLRAGSPVTAYSNLFAPGTDLSRLMEAQGVRLVASGPNVAQVAAVVARATGLSETAAHHAVEHGPRIVTTRGLSEAEAVALRDQLVGAGATAEVAPLETHAWPKPYDTNVNPLSIDLTAFNTFILICSSVTMVLALSAIQQGNKRRLFGYLLATLLIGSTFLGVQVYEYYQLMFGHFYPVGISPTHHFRPSASLFASCFFTMTGFHGAHVFGGVVSIACLVLGAMFGRFTRENHAAVEMVGLYWHFVDLVWIILFTIVYLI